MKYRSIHEIAQKKVRSKRRFNIHFALYFCVMFFLSAINIFNGIWHDGLWVKYPIVTWGSLVMLHYLLIYGFPFKGALSEAWEKRQYAKELEKLGRATGDEYDGLNLEDRLELEELDRLKAKWENDHYV